MLQHAVAAVLSAVVLAPFSFYAGRAANLLRLPQITGYLVSGVICGPYVLGILSKLLLSDLNVIEGACLSIIGLAAGAEVYLPDLHAIRRQVLLVTTGIAVGTWGCVYIALAWLGAHGALLPSMGPYRITAAASLAATLMIARSPASAIAVLKEVEGKGPFSTLVMAVVVVKDVAVIIAFALNIEVARLVILPHGESVLTATMVVLPVAAVAVSMALGVLGALVMSVLLRPGVLLRPQSTPAHTTRVRQAVVALGATVVFYTAHGLQLDGLLACLTTGVLLANRRHERAEQDREDLNAAVTAVMQYSNVAFFGLAGASLQLDAVASAVGVAAVVFTARLAGIWLGSWCGCRLGGTSVETRRTFWMSMVTQAGVAMGLARLAGTKFPHWGPYFQTLMMAVIMGNMFVGPPLFRIALLRAGEARVYLKGRHDDSVDGGAEAKPWVPSADLEAPVQQLQLRHVVLPQQES